MTFFSPRASINNTTSSNRYGVTDIPAPKYARLVFTNGSKIVISTGSNVFPDFTLESAAVVDSNGAISIPSGGNPSNRIYSDDAIEDLLSLADADFSEHYNIRFEALRIWRDSTGEAFVAGEHERLWQHGASGVVGAQDGGRVTRINGSTVANQGNIGCVVPALHWDYGVKSGASEDLIIGYTAGYEVGFEGPSTRRMDQANGSYDSTNGHFVMIAYHRYYRGSNMAIHLFTDDDTRITYPDTHNYPFPGRSNYAPASDSSSAGFTLFAQSTNTGAAVLKKSTVWPPVIGEARDLVQLEALIANLKLDWSADPYRNT